MTSFTNIPELSLNDGTNIPQLGFGVYQIEPSNTINVVSEALSKGYRHVDTSMAYANEAEVGTAIRSINEHVYVSTKYFNADDRKHGYEDAKAAFDASYKALGLEYINLYLIHWPMLEKELYVDAWKAFIELRGNGRVRSIGVSNFSAGHLKRIIEETGVTPAVNQVEVHPYFQQDELRKVHAELGIVTEAWSPLAGGKAIDDKVLIEIGKNHNKSASQVILRWHIQLGNVIIPKSVTPKRIEENYNIFDFSLSDEEMLEIKKLDRGERTGPDPSTFVFPRDYRGKAHSNVGT